MTATASTSSSSVWASPSAASMTALTSCRWWREATSGTTPPYSWWKRACEETTLDSTVPSSVTAAQVSSQLVSRASSRKGKPQATPACARLPASHMIRASSPLSW